MEKCVRILLTSLVVLLNPVVASAAFPANCEDNCMGDWDSDAGPGAPTCDSLCQDDSGVVRCVFRGALDPATTVYAYSDSGDFVIFGEMGGDLFCCDDSDVTFDSIFIETDADDDVVCLRPYNLGGDECSPDDAHTNTCTFDTDSDWDDTTTVRTHRGTDHVSGSNFEDGCGYNTPWCDHIDLGVGVSGSGNEDRANAGGGGDWINADGDYGAIIWGGNGRDKILGTDGADSLLGGDIDGDVILGADGDDSIEVGNADDNWANGQGGTDTIKGGAHVDTLCGAWGSDGNEDTIRGWGGDDTCIHNTDDVLLTCEEEWTTCPAPEF